MPRRKKLVPIGSRVGMLIHKSGRTKSGVATDAGLARSTVTRLVKGEREPGLPVLEAVASSLGITVEELVRGTDAEEKLDDG